MALRAAGGPRAAWRACATSCAHAIAGCSWCSTGFALPLAVFFLARSRLELYLLPLFAPLALLLARPLARWDWLDDRRSCA